MMRHKILVLIFATFLVCANERTDASIPFTSKFISPDGSYAVDFTMIDKEHHFRITDLKTNRVDDSIVMPSLVLYLRWASNSRAFVTVEHTAGGSYGRVVCLTGGKWKSLEVAPPDDATTNFQVLAVNIRADSVHFKFSLDHRNSGGVPISYMFYDLDIKLRACEPSNIHWTATSRTEWLRSLNEKPKYSPSMESGR